MNSYIDWVADPHAWIALVTLTVLEIVLGIDNIVFISILSSKLPPGQRGKARSLGLAMALFGRIALLLSISWVMGLQDELFRAVGRGYSGRDLILLGGGLFLLYKATHEIHGSLAGEEKRRASGRTVSFAGVIAQILVLDLDFSLDSVITAVGMAEHLGVMVAAVVIAVVFMMWSAGAVSEFIQRHPTVKMLALSFLLLVGVALIADAFAVHLPRGYIYFAMGFSVMVEVLNLKLRSRAEPVELRDRGPRLGG
jgi:predicted tellurium resistance membrane protein TerC